MNMTLYTNESADNVVTKRLSAPLATLTGTLRKDCSIIDPVIEVEAINNSIAASCNYAKIDEFGRYYFVRNIEFTGKLFRIHMHVDVLSSFQTQLKALDAIVTRQENKYNLYLDDGMFKTYSNPNISVFKFPGSFDTYQYILSVSGA